MRSYLAEADETDRKRDDHPSRMKDFRQQLGNAKQAADPLVRIDEALYRLTNSDPLEFLTVCSQFPFGDGHPAQDAARSVVGDASYATSLQDSSSVLVSSYINRPVYPLAVRSFAEPVAEALQGSGGPEQRSAKFWMWRRSRTLEAFVPLPREAMSDLRIPMPIRLVALATAVVVAASCARPWPAEPPDAHEWQLMVAPANLVPGLDGEVGFSARPSGTTAPSCG